MKEALSEEMLSAYVDGELAGQERAAVEAWLAEDPAAREKVEDFRRLSGLFSGIPRTEVPQEFPANVLQLAERRMLLPEPAAVRRQQPFRRWLVAVGAPLASAAVLFVIAQVLRHSGAPQAARERELALSPDIASARSALPTNTPAGEMRPASGPAVAAGTAAGDAAGEPSIAGVSDRARGPAAAPRLAAARAGAPLEDEALDHPQLAELDDALQRVVASDSRGATIAVMKAYVADSADGMILVQNVLAENQIVPEGEGLEATVSPPAIKTSAEAAAGAREEGLYVVAEKSQLIAAFKKMLDREKPAIRLEAEDPIELAVLDKGSRARFEQVDQEVAASGSAVPAKKEWPASPAKKPGQAEHGKGSAEALPQSKTTVPAARSEPATVARGPAEKNVRDQKRVATSEKEGPADRLAVPEGAIARRDANATTGMGARQAVVRFPEEIAQRARAADSPQALGVKRKAMRAEFQSAPASAGQPARGDKGKDNEPPVGEAPAPVRLLILIEREARRPAAPAGSEPVKKGQSGGAS